MKMAVMILIFFTTQLLFGIDISKEDIVPKMNPMSILSIISLSKILWTIFFCFGAYIFIYIITKLLEFFAEKSSKMRIFIKGLIPIIRIVLWVIFIIVVLKMIYQPPKEMIFGALASVAIAVGFATQDLLKNIFGGIMLLFERPFRVGDKIEAGEYYGEVRYIGLRATQIITPEDSVVVIPNMELMNAALANANSGELNCQVITKIALPIDAPIKTAKNIAIESAQVSKYIYLNKPITVLFSNKINEQKSYLEMKIKAYVMDIRYEFLFQSDMTEIVIKELIAQKIIGH